MTYSCGARISHAKAPGPIAQRMLRLMIPLMLKTMNVEKTMAAIGAAVASFVRAVRASG